MRATVTLLVLLSASSVAFAQPIPPPSEPAVVWGFARPNSAQFLLQGHQVRVLIGRNVAAIAFVESASDPMPIYVHFVNRGDRPFDVIPESFTLSVVFPKDKILEYVSPRQVAKKIENAATWAIVAEALAGMSRSIAGTSTTSTSGTVNAWSATGGSVYGTYNGVTRTYDNAANQQLMASNMAAISDTAEAQKLRQLTGALLPNTVFAGQTFGGIVHFKREKRAKGVILRMPVAGEILEIALDVPEK